MKFVQITKMLSVHHVQFSLVNQLRRDRVSKCYLISPMHKVYHSIKPCSNYTASIFTVFALLFITCPITNASASIKFLQYMIYFLDSLVVIFLNDFIYSPNHLYSNINPPHQKQVSFNFSSSLRSNLACHATDQN